MNEVLARPILGERGVNPPATPESVRDSRGFAARARSGFMSLLQRRRDEIPLLRAAVKVHERPDLLLQRLQNRDDSALEPFIQATQSSAYRLAMSILNDRDRCQDVLQDVYLIVFQKAAQLRDTEKWKSWFSQIVVNRCRQEFRERRLEPLDDIDLPSPDGHTEQVEQRLDLRQALARLPEQDRSVLTLREVMQLSYEEIATTLDIPLGTVRSRLFNARQRMLAALSERRA